MRAIHALGVLGLLLVTALAGCVSPPAPAEASRAFASSTDPALAQTPGDAAAAKPGKGRLVVEVENQGAAQVASLTIRRTSTWSMQETIVLRESSAWSKAFELPLDTYEVTLDRAGGTLQNEADLWDCTPRPSVTRFLLKFSAQSGVSTYGGAEGTVCA
jgi:hypothetical protein